MVETGVSLERTPDGRRVEIAARLRVAPETAYAVVCRRALDDLAALLED